jgi:hypothetical protein
MQFQVLALLERKVESSSRPSAPRSSHTRVVHLLPIPSDEGCTAYFGSVSSTVRHTVSSDFRNLVSGLNCRNHIVQESELHVEAAVPDRPQLRRQPTEHAVPWQILRVNFPPLGEGNDFCVDLKGHGNRFRPAVPCPEFQVRKFSSAAAAGGGVAHFKKMSKGQKKKARQIAKRAQTSLTNMFANPPDESSDFLSPGDIPRVRLFLCYHSDVEAGGNLPSKHFEIDPFRPLAESISEFELKFSGHRSALPRTHPRGDDNHTAHLLCQRLAAHAPPGPRLKYLTADTNACIAKAAALKSLTRAHSITAIPGSPAPATIPYLFARRLTSPQRARAMVVLRPAGVGRCVPPPCRRSFTGVPFCCFVVTPLDFRHTVLRRRSFQSGTAPRHFLRQRRRLRAVARAGRAAVAALNAGL